MPTELDMALGFLRQMVRVRNRADDGGRHPETLPRDFDSLSELEAYRKLVEEAFVTLQIGGASLS